MSKGKNMGDGLNKTLPNEAVDETHMPGATPGDAVAQLKIGNQYIKSLNFKSYAIPSHLQQNKPLKVAYNLDYGTTQLAEKEFEVFIKLTAKCTDDNKNIYEAELIYAGTFTLQGDNTKGLHALRMVDCPRILYPAAIFYFNNAIRDGGFPPVALSQINFAARYQQELAKRQQKEGTMTTQQSQ